ncbi:hypothetical protein PAHAL_2G067800 [Panicum hallii]|jgi:hypothetical protein|uniref:F-box domain-containing protein n=1 Tax=Panicum hallii TaxID=206008 RepID=A0A2S3GWF0_9POAL|nr:hypothetical protein PAHAL_2G067800 [Panicum hallii]
MADGTVTSPSRQDGRGGGDGDGHNRLSNLPDHILLLVLERLRGDVRSLASTCVLSRRWRMLPLMLSDLTISVRTFVPADRGRTTAQVRRQATGSFTGALRLFLATPTAAGGSGGRSGP